MTIKPALQEYAIFELKLANIDHVYQILVITNDKEAMGFEGDPCKLLKIGASPLAAT